MPRLAPLNREDLPEDHREYYDSIQEARGLDPSDRRIVMPDVFRIMLRSPELATRVAWTPMAIRAGDLVTQEVQEIVVLTVSREAMAPVQWGIHVIRGRDEGVREEVIQGIQAHDTSKMDDRERLLVDFAARSYHQRMTDAVYANVTELLGERVVLELTVLVGFTTMMIQILDALGIKPWFDVDLELPEIDEQLPELWSAG